MVEYIKRDDAILRMCACFRFTQQMSSRILEAVPTADVVPRELYQRALSDVVTLSVERKRGEWIRVTEELGESWMCSECMEEFIPNDGMEEFASYAHFCPNCGAKMGIE